MRCCDKSRVVDRAVGTDIGGLRVIDAFCF
jgi:hypothetical protein